MDNPIPDEFIECECGAEMERIHIDFDVDEMWNVYHYACGVCGRDEEIYVDALDDIPF